MYAKQNGGHYNFIVENKTAKAIPLDQVILNLYINYIIFYEPDVVQYI